MDVPWGPRCQGIGALGQPWRVPAWGEEGRGGRLWEGGRWLTLPRHGERGFCFLFLLCPVAKLGAGVRRAWQGACEAALGGCTG